MSYASQLEGMRNDYPVTCDWCNLPLIPFEGRKVMMSTYDAYDYNWACPGCYDKIRWGEL